MLLEIENLTKVFRGGVRANDEIDLSIAAGEVFGLLGHNGAGKTTLVSQVVGLLKPTAGAIRIDGRDMIADPGMARRLCSFQAQSQVPIDGLTPRQAIELLGQLRGASRSDVRRRRALLVDALGLGEWLDVDAARLSGGVKRLVAFAMAAVTPGRLVMLDEPTNDVDPVRRRLLWQQVRSLADEGAAVLLVTHNVVEAERSVDRLAILDAGRVIAEGTPAELKAGLGAELRLELVIDPSLDGAPRLAFRPLRRPRRQPAYGRRPDRRRGAGRGLGGVAATGRRRGGIHSRAGHPGGRLRGAGRWPGGQIGRDGGETRCKRCVVTDCS
jgi:ABC-2 type transport system ATP-binding protein